MWRDHHFSQRNKTKRPVGVEVGGSVDKICKGGGAGGNIGGLHKVGDYEPTGNYGKSWHFFPVILFYTAKLANFGNSPNIKRE